MTNAFFYPVAQVRHDRRDGSSINDCYVAFRRRTEKMQTRKVRDFLFEIQSTRTFVQLHVQA